MATASHVSSAEEVVSLLSIPVEIRNMIYRNLLVDSDKISFYFVNYRSADPRLHTSILTTCKQVSFEATRIFYAGNVFLFWATACMSEWLDTIAPENARAIQNAEISEAYEATNTDALRKVFERCTGLRRLQFDWTSMWGGPPPEYYVGGLFQSAKRVVRDHAKLKMVACAHWTSRHEPVRHPLDADSITLVANVGDLGPLDGEIFDIEKAVEQYAKSTKEKNVHFLF